jgi:hypothetical protein
MTGKNKEKDGYYSKIIQKDEFPKFIERLKSALEKVDNKKGDKKYFEFEIRGTKEEQSGLTLEIFSFDENKYEEFIDEGQEYIKNSLYCISLNLTAKEETGVEKLKELFIRFKPMFEAIPFLKNKVEFFFRNKENQVYLDMIVKEGKLIKALLDLGIDLTEYRKFNIALITGINIYDFLHEEEPDLFFIEILSLIFYIRAETDNCRYLLIALSEALKDVKIDNEKIQKKFDKFINFLRFINSFIRNKFKIEYDAKILAEKVTKNKEIEYGGEKKLKEKIIGTQQMSIGMFQTMGIPMLQSFNLTDAIKSTDLDNISISLTVPKYKNGLALSLKIPELSKTLDELIDNYENSIKK